MSTANSAASNVKNVEDQFKILVATDIHLGYNEKNRTLVEDSFVTFEEILQIANSREVDFILLGGDLFDQATPSMYAMHRCLELLRTYVLGDREIGFEFLSDQNQNFPDSFIHAVNYEDSNLNVSIPVFSIHGNHDDMSGAGRLSSMNILSSVGYINYFGKWQDLSEVEITPIVLQKNKTKIAMYGLSHILDSRLARLLRDKKVKVAKPNIDDDEIFNLMVLHQNRADRGRFNYIPEDKLPGFLDLIIWGHEHDCRIDPEPNGKIKAYISQPGSSVATSLCEGEAIDKHVGVLTVNVKEFSMKPVKLRTVRPFIFRTVNIDELVEELRLNEGDIRNKSDKFYSQQVEEMIVESQAKLTGHVKQPKVPLIRLRILYTNENHVINTARFGQKFENRVANPESVLLFKKNVKRQRNVAHNPDEAALQKAFDKKEQKNRVEDVVESYFNSVENDNDQLQLFDLKSLTEVCRLLVDMEDDDASNKILDMHFEKSVAYMKSKMCHEENIPEVLESFRTEESKKVFDLAVIENSKNPATRKPQPSIAMSDDEDVALVQTPPTRGRGSRGGRAAANSTRGSRAAPTVAARGSRAATTARGKKAAETSDNSIVAALKRNKANQSSVAQSTVRSNKSHVSIYNDDISSDSD